MSDPAEIRLINQVAAHFVYLSDDDAAAAVANHVRKFWEPRMRHRLLDLAESHAFDLEPAARAAARRLS